MVRTTRLADDWIEVRSYDDATGELTSVHELRPTNHGLFVEHLKAFEQAVAAQESSPPVVDRRVLEFPRHASVVAALLMAVGL